MWSINPYFSWIDDSLSLYLLYLIADWDGVKIKAANFNSGALNALFNAVTNKEFKKISSTETAKEAWTILQTTYEGTKAIKDSKL